MQDLFTIIDNTVDKTTNKITSITLNKTILMEFNFQMNLISKLINLPFIHLVQNTLNQCTNQLLLNLKDMKVHIKNNNKHWIQKSTSNIYQESKLMKYLISHRLLLQDLQEHHYPMLSIFMIICNWLSRTCKN